MLKIGVFGAGQPGKIHIAHWKEVPGTELAGFYEPDDTIAASAIEQFGLERYSDVDDLVAVIDLAVIATATGAQFEIAKKCLLNQKHLFIETPITRSLEEAAQLVKLVREANVKCQVGHIERYNPAFLALANKPLQPMFIEAHRLAMFTPGDTNTSVIMDLMIHDIDMVLHMVKSPVRRISASGVAIVSETADIANARIEFDNGCVANLTSSRISLKNMRKTRIFQQDAYIGIDFLEKKTEIVSLKDVEDSGSFPGMALEMPNGEKKVICVDAPGIGFSDPYRMELEEFADAVLNDKPVRVSIYDGFQAMDVAEQVLKKMSSHNEMHNV